MKTNSTLMRTFYYYSLPSPSSFAGFPRLLYLVKPNQTREVLIKCHMDHFDFFQNIVCIKYMETINMRFTLIFLVKPSSKVQDHGDKNFSNWLSGVPPALLNCRRTFPGHLYLGQPVCISPWRLKLLLLQ